MTARFRFAMLAPLLALGAPAASHPETRSFLVTGDAEAALLIHVPWAAMVGEWRNSATLWRESGPVELTYEADCGPEMAWRFEAEQPGAPLPDWLRRGDAALDQREHIDRYMCGEGDGPRAPMARRMGSGRDAAARFRALVAAGVRPGPARGIAAGGRGEPELIDALGQADISAGSIDEVRARARAIVETR